ncbi:MAG: TlpA disulfide reductase family protein [Holophaga sp.]|jgi:thiol-disulfide isomerase/thioredoxin
MSTHLFPSRGLLIVCLLGSSPAFSDGPGLNVAPRFMPRPQSFGSSGSQAGPGPGSVPPQQIGAPAADIHGINALGAATRLSQLKGKVILLDVSAMWCYWCQQDAPSIQNLYKTYGPNGLAVATCLTQDNNGGGPVSLAGLKQWTSTYHLTQTVMNDASGTSGGAAEQAYVSVTGSFPTIVLIDKTFKVQYIQGGFDLNAVIAKIQALLAE